MAAIASMYDSEAESYDGHEIRAELCLVDDHAKTFYSQLEEMKEHIEKEFGQPLLWYNPPDKKMSKIYIRKSVDLEAQDDWPNQHEWLLINLESLHRVFAKRIKQLKPDG